MRKKQDVNGVLDLYAQNANRVDATHLANIYGALAEGVGDVEKLKIDDRFKMLLKSTIEKLQSTLEWFDVRGIATITHSLGKLKIFDERFFNEIEKLRKRIAKAGNTQELSNIVWACATVGCESAELFEAVAGQHKRIAKSGNVQDMSNICWSFAKLECNADALFGAVAAQHKRIAKSDNVQAMSNICWAFAKLDYKAAELFEAVAGQHKLIARDGKVQELSNITWACAKLECKAAELFEAVAAQHGRIVRDGNLQAMSNICWAFATVGHEAKDLFKAVAAQYGRIAKTGNVQNMSNICWAFATVGHEAKDLFKAVAAQHGRIVRDGNEQHVANTLWSFAIAGYLDEGRGLVEKLWKRACDGRLQCNFDELQQLALFYAAAQIEELNLNLEPPPESLLGLIEAAAAKSLVTVSRSHQEVSSTLTKLNIDHKMEVSPFENSIVNFNTSAMLNIDIMISTKNETENKKIAIEFNGPFHYIHCNGQDVESGTTKFKQRLLEKLNFTVVSIHWDDWRRAINTNTSKDFLRNLIA